MKRNKLAIFGSFVLIIAAFGMTARAQETDTISVKMGQNKRAPKSGVRIRLVAVLEDSRCPIGTNCVWAGNAKIKVVMSFDGKTETVELNTNTGRRGGKVDYWAVNLESLTPSPKSGVTLKPRNYLAKFTIVRIQR